MYLCNSTNPSRNKNNTMQISERAKLVISLIILQLCFAGFHIVSRIALNIGVSKIVYPIYRNIIALLLVGPFAYFMEK